MLLEKKIDDFVILVSKKKNISVNIIQSPLFIFLHRFLLYIIMISLHFQQVYYTELQETVKITQIRNNFYINKEITIRNELSVAKQFNIQ